MTEMSQQEIFRQAAEGLNKDNIKALTTSVYQTIKNSLISLYNVSTDELGTGVIAPKASQDLTLNMKPGTSPMQARGREWFELSLNEGAATIDLSVVENNGRLTGGNQILVDFSYLDANHATVAILEKMKIASPTFAAKLKEGAQHSALQPVAA